VVAVEAALREKAGVVAGGLRRRTGHQSVAKRKLRLPEESRRGGVHESL
jgi:hypothetical protein